MNAMVENFIGHIKDQLVLEFNTFATVIAPASNPAEWLDRLKAFQEMLNAFGRRWNTSPQADGTSRLQKYRERLLPGSTDITEEEIDRAVRYSMRCSYRKGVHWDKDIYDNPDLFHHHHDPEWVVVRVRPEGPGPDMEVYVRGEHIGTLHRYADHPDMSKGMISAGKAYIDRHRVLNQKRIERFKDYTQQLMREGVLGTPEQQRIVRGEQPPPDASPAAPEAFEGTTPPAPPDIAKGWSGGNI